MLVNKGTKMHYLFLFFFHLFISASVLGHPHAFTGKSLSLLIVFQKNIFLVLVGKTTPSTPRWQNIYFPSFSKTLSPFHDAKFSIFLFFFYNSPLFSHSGPSLHINFLQSHADSWFVYQNIDLFSLYTFTLALLLVHFFSFSPLPKAPLTGHPLLVIDLPAKQSLAARGTRGRQGSIHLGILVSNWQCRHLCWGRGAGTFIWLAPFQNENTEFPADG